MPKGQISLEFLMILLMSFAILVIFMPTFNKVFSNTSYALDVYNSNKVIGDIEQAFSMFENMSDGSHITLTAHSFNGYKIFCEDSTLKVLFGNNSQEKTVCQNVPCSGDIDVNGTTKIRLIKENNIIKIE